MKALIRIFALIAFGAVWIPCSFLKAEDFVDMNDLLDIDDLLDDDGTVSNGARSNIADPLKGLNRVIFGFNNSLYKNVFQPLTRQYVRVIPREARRGLGHFFNNLEYPVRLTGSILQLKLGRATQETGKFIVNTTAGFGGFIDASKNFESLNPREEDIGQAFGAWGIKHGFYMILPFAGPSSLRDLVGRIGGNYVDPISDPWSQIDDSRDRLFVQAIDTINDLPEIIDIYNSITESAIDPYTAVRDGYAQFRAAQIAE